MPNNWPAALPYVFSLCTPLRMGKTIMAVKGKPSGLTKPTMEGKIHLVRENIEVKKNFIVTSGKKAVRTTNRIGKAY